MSLSEGALMQGIRIQKSDEPVRNFNISACSLETPLVQPDC